MNNDWQPIETAPRDRTRILLLGTNGNSDVGEWYDFDPDFDKSRNGIPDDQTGEFSTEYGEGPFSHWRELNK